MNKLIKAKQQLNIALFASEGNFIYHRWAMSRKKFNDVKEHLSPRSYAIMAIRKQHFKNKLKVKNKLKPCTFIYQVTMIIHSIKPNTMIDKIQYM